MYFYDLLKIKFYNSDMVIDFKLFEIKAFSSYLPYFYHSKHFLSAA